MTQTTVDAAGRRSDTRPGLLADALGPLRQRWDAMQPRERAAVGLAAVVVGLGLVWSVAVQPAWTTVRDAPARLDALDLDLQRMQRLAGEARELKATQPVSAAQAGLALKAATDRLGGGATIVVQGDRATLTVTGVDAERLRAWLAESRTAARARPVEMRLTQGPNGYGGTLVVVLAGAAP
jgi:general secretion pathway protein M